MVPSSSVFFLLIQVAGMTVGDLKPIATAIGGGLHAMSC